jgi:hypothetical protein
MLEDLKLMVYRDTVPAGLIVTGPNIASQSLLFSQLSERLQSEINGPIVILRSGDASNLKAVLKQLIRDATNQRSTDDDEEGVVFEREVSRRCVSWPNEAHKNRAASFSTMIWRFYMLMRKPTERKK